VDHRIDKDCRVVHYFIGDILREAGFDLFQCLLHAGGDRHGIGPGRLVDEDRLAGPPVITNQGVGRLRAEFGAGDVLDPDDPSVGGRADNDVVELLDRGQPTLCANVELEFHLGDERRRPDTADRGLSVLRVDRVDDILGRDVEAGHAVQIEPDPHRIFEISPLARITDTRYPFQGVDYVDLGVIRQEQRVTGPFGRVDRDDLQ